MGHRDDLIAKSILDLSSISALPAVMVVGLALAVALLIPATAGADVLFDQSTGPSAQSTPSQDFEPINNNFDAEVADDFVVPAGRAWRIEEIFTRGLKNGTNIAKTAKVTLYSDSSGMPGSQILNELTTIKAGTYPRLELPIASKPVLQAGTYWLGVQVNMPADPDASQWFWADNPVQAGSPAVFRNPGNGFLSGCTAFSPRNTCSFGSTPANPEPDQMFKISGTDFSQVPDTIIDSGPADGSTINADSTSFGFSSSDPESTFECSIEGGSFAPCTSAVSMVGLAPGSHSFAVRATNGLGTVDPTPASRQFTVEFSGTKGPSAKCINAKAKKKKAQKKLRSAKKRLKKAKKKKAKKKAAKGVKKAKTALGTSKTKVKKVC